MRIATSFAGIENKFEEQAFSYSSDDFMADHKKTESMKLVPIDNLKKCSDETNPEDGWNAIVLEHFHQLKKDQPDLWLIELLNASAHVTTKNYLVLYRSVKKLVQSYAERKSSHSFDHKTLLRD